MIRTFAPLALWLLAAVPCLLAGCSPAGQGPAAPTDGVPATEVTDDTDHGHADDHDHDGDGVPDHAPEDHDDADHDHDGDGHADHAAEDHDHAEGDHAEHDHADDE